MSFSRGLGQAQRDGPPDGPRATVAHEERRRATRPGRMGTATLACARCDAPVAIGAERLALAAQLTCPFCRHRGAVRDFLSLASPTRPARVVLRVGYRP